MGTLLRCLEVMSGPAGKSDVERAEPRMHAEGSLRPGQLREYWRFWRDVVLPASGMSTGEQALVTGWLRNGVSWRDFQTDEVAGGDGAAPERFAENYPMVGVTSTGESVKQWLDGRIQLYLERGFIVPWDESYGPVVVNPVGCELSKPRFVLDGSWFSSFCNKPEIKLQTLRDLQRLLTPGSLLWHLDLKDGYFMVPIAKDTSATTAFMWEGRLFVFVALPFGSRISPGVFQKITAAWGAFLRRFRIALIVYLDDFTGVGGAAEYGRSKEQRAADSVWVALELGYISGLVFNRAKCTMIPSSRLTSLGMIVDASSDVWSFQVPDAKRVAILELARELLVTPSVKQLERFVGKAMSLLLCMPAMRYYTQPLYAFVAGWLAAHGGRRSGMASPVVLPLKVKAAIEDFTETSMACWQTMSRWRPMRHHTYECKPMVLSSDAAGGSLEHGCGWGGTLLSREEEECSWSGGFESRGLQDEDIAVKEAWAVVWTCEAASRDLNLRHAFVDLFTDNTVALASLHKYRATGGGMRAAVQAFIAWQLRENVQVHMSYISSKANGLSDARSRTVDRQALVLSDAVFRECMRWAGVRCSVDIFASFRNRKTRRYYGWFDEFKPNMIGRNCLSFDVAWAPGSRVRVAETREIVWAFPPDNLLGVAWCFLRECRARGLFFCPARASEPWFGAVQAQAKQWLIVVRKGAPVFRKQAEREGTLEIVEAAEDYGVALFDFI